MGITEESSPDGSSIFRAPLDLGEGAWARSQADDKGGLATNTCCIDPGTSPREPRGKAHPQTSAGVQVEWRKRGVSTDTCYENTITCSGRVARLEAGRLVQSNQPRTAYQRVYSCSRAKNSISFSASTPVR